MTDKSKLLFYSNPPQAASGYGITMRNLLPRLVKLGYTVGVQSNCIYSGSAMSIEGYAIYPHVSGLGEWETLETFKQHNYDYLITLYDNFVLDNFRDACPRQKIPWINWCPIDHLELYDWMKDKLNASNWIVAMSNYGMDLLEKSGYNNKSYIPLGVDCSIFKPIVNDIPKSDLKTEVGFSPDTFLIAIMKMNKGSRTGYPYMLEGIKIFRESNPDIKVGLYMHCEPNRQDGYNLLRLLKHFGLEEITRAINVYQYTIGYSTLQMAKLYNSFDVVLNTTLSEGFGIPIVEALACGIPVICTNIMSMRDILTPVLPELLVKTVEVKFWEQFPVAYGVPNVYDIADKIEKALIRDNTKDTEVLPKYAKENFDWDLIANSWDALIQDMPNILEKQCFMPEVPSEYLKQKAIVVSIA